MSRKPAKQRKKPRKRRDTLRVERSSEGAGALRELRRNSTKPLAVGPLAGRGAPGSTPVPLAMTVTIDPRSIVGLESVMQASKHHSFDVVTSWQVVVHDDPRVEALAFLRVQIPERKLDFGVEFVVDELRRSFTAASLTKRVILVDPAFTATATVRPPQEAFEKHLSLGLDIEDARPIVRVLEQRFDFGEEEPGAEKFALNDENRTATGEAFAKGARTPAEYGVQVGIGRPRIHLVDKTADSELAALAAEEHHAKSLVGRWGAMVGDQDGIVRFDLLGPSITRSWLIVEPDQRVVRAAASGEHFVDISFARIEDPAAPPVGPRVSVLVPGSEAMRAMLR